MFGLPRYALLAAGTGVGSTDLTAFDLALLNAGIGDFNMLRVSSIVPPRAEVLLLDDAKARSYISQLTKGSLVPVVYGVAQSDLPGEIVAAAVAVGLPSDRENSGVIFEAHVLGRKQAAEDLAISMVKDGLCARGIGDFKIIATSAEITVTHGVACAVSAALLLE